MKVGLIAFGASYTAEWQKREATAEKIAKRIIGVRPSWAELTELDAHLTAKALRNLGRLGGGVTVSIDAVLTWQMQWDHDAGRSDRALRSTLRVAMDVGIPTLVGAAAATACVASILCALFVAVAVGLVVSKAVEPISDHYFGDLDGQGDWYTNYWRDTSPVPLAVGTPDVFSYY